jgi:hypothetical protein
VDDDVEGADEVAVAESSLFDLEDRVALDKMPPFF